jgi:hypothetical protein
MSSCWTACFSTRKIPQAVAAQRDAPPSQDAHAVQSQSGPSHVLLKGDTGSEGGATQQQQRLRDVAAKHTSGENGRARSAGTASLVVQQADDDRRSSDTTHERSRECVEPASGEDGARAEQTTGPRESEESTDGHSSPDHPDDNPAEQATPDGRDLHGLHEPGGPADTMTCSLNSTAKVAHARALEVEAPLASPPQDEKLVGRDVEANVGMEVYLSAEGHESYMNRLIAGGGHGSITKVLESGSFCAVCWHERPGELHFHDTGRNERHELGYLLSR